MIFPPSVLVSGLVGAGAGALIGHLHGGMSRSGLKEIGEMLDESEAALIVVGEATVEEQTRRAKKEMKKEVRAQAKEIEKAIDEAWVPTGPQGRKESQWRSTANRCPEG